MQHHTELSAAVLEHLSMTMEESPLLPPKSVPNPGSYTTETESKGKENQPSQLRTYKQAGGVSPQSSRGGLSPGRALVSKGPLDYRAHEDTQHIFAE